MALNQAILVCAFKKNLCIAAYAGAIEIGEVENQEYLIFKDESSFVVQQKKVPEFFLILEALGRNIAVEEKNDNCESTQFQLCGDQILRLEKTKIARKSQTYPATQLEFILEFDEFVYIDFMTALSNILLFVTMPTKEQFFLMKKYAEIEHEHGTSQEKIDRTTKNIPNASPHRIFLLNQFLTINLHVVETFSKILRIIGKK